MKLTCRNWQRCGNFSWPKPYNWSLVFW